MPTGFKDDLNTMAMQGNVRKCKEMLEQAGDE